MNNIFQIGGVVSGDSFIGRRALVAQYKNDYLASNNRVGRTIVGLTRIGKTSFADVVFSDVPDNILVIKHDLKLSDSYNALWKKICLRISKYLISHNIKANYLERLLADIKASADMDWVEFEENIVDIFDELNELGIRTIIVLDEFDYAEDLFDGKTHYFELFRTLFADHKVSSMLLSRRQIHSIEKTTYQSSTFHGVLEPIYFQGFNNDDIVEYYGVFEKNGIILSEDQKDEIEYYAGRAPFLLSIIGYYIFEAVNNGEEIDIAKIFKNRCKAINDYYRDCIKHLTRDDDMKRIIPFIIGPNVGVTQNDRDELINLGYLREQDEILVAISSHFVNLLSGEMLGLSIWDSIINLEKRIKVLIECEFIALVDHFQSGGNTVNAVQRGIFEQIEGVSKNLTMYDSFIANNLKSFNKKSTYIEVMSLKDSFRLLKVCWADVFAKYFNNDMYSTWEGKFEKCAKARNPVAHGHEEYLTELDKNEVDTYCKQIFEILSKSNNNTSTPNEAQILNAASKYSSAGNVVTAINYTNPIESLVGKEVDLIILMRGGVKKANLRGVIDNKYKGIIPKTDLQNKSDEELDEMIGTTVKVRVDRINGDHYELNYDSTSEADLVADREETSLGYSIGDLIASSMNE